MPIDTKFRAGDRDAIQRIVDAKAANYFERAGTSRPGRTRRRLRVSPARGPSGVAAFPPAALATAALPIEILPARMEFHRVHRTEHHPIFFGPGPGAPPTYRFDSASGSFGVLYVAFRFAGALVETLSRNPRRKMVAQADIEARASSVVRCRRALRVVQLHSAGLQILGLDNSISTGPYEPCGAWADALWAHPDAPDGLAFRSNSRLRRCPNGYVERSKKRRLISWQEPRLSALV
jgi:hypothetical protein